MKYITRVDDDKKGQFWVVSIGAYRTGMQSVKTFQDKKHNGTIKAYKAAVKWRNQELERLWPVLRVEYGLDENDQRYWGEGVYESLTPNGKGNAYLRVFAHYFDPKTKKQTKASFSVLKYGYDEAYQLAHDWRQAKLSGEL